MVYTRNRLASSSLYRGQDYQFWSLPGIGQLVLVYSQSRITRSGLYQDYIRQFQSIPGVGLLVLVFFRGEVLLVFVNIWSRFAMQFQSKSGIDLLVLVYTRIRLASFSLYWEQVHLFLSIPGVGFIVLIYTWSIIYTWSRFHSSHISIL